MRRGSQSIAAAVALELAPAAVLNFAVAFAAASVLRQAGMGDLAALASVASGIAAFLIAWVGLRGFGKAGGGFALPAFDHGPVEVDALPELLLTDVFEPSLGGQDELLLDDILERIGPESRVVRLFEPGALPTAGELQARIDRHLRIVPAPSPAPDATEELHEALAALRQSLR